MAALLTVAQLAVVARETIADNDPEALEVIRLASEAVLDYMQLDDLPTDIEEASLRDQRTVKRVALIVAKRNWRNPDQLRSEGGVGPLGGDTFGDDMQEGYDLSDGEKAALDRTNIEGAFSDSGSDFIVRTTVPKAAALPDIALGTENPFWHYASWEDRGAFGL